MRITQEQFNGIIDLLGHAANAEAAHRARVIVDDTDPQIEENARESLANYLGAVSNLYQTEEYPAVYLQAFDKKCENYTKSGKRQNTHISNHRLADSRLTYLIYIGDIIDQLDRDFASIDEDGQVTVQPRSTYTGTFETSSYCRDTIASNTETFHCDFVEFHTDTPDPSFAMQIMSHPVTPIIGAILFLAGVALITSGAGTGLGVCMATAGVILIAGYAATKLGFFAERPNPTIPDSLATLMRTQPVI